MARPVTIRESLIRSFTPVVLVFAVAAFALLFLAGRFAVRTLSAALIDQTYERVVGRLDSFVEPVLIEMKELRLDAGAGQLRPDDVPAARGRLHRVVGSVPHVTSAIVADTSGREVMTMREPGGEHVTRVSHADGSTALLRETREGGELSREPGPEGYDPRDRPWYAGAQRVGRGGLHWTEPYRFFTSGEYGVTLSAEAGTPGGGAVIVALDVRLAELDEFTRTLRLQKNGQAFLMDQGGRLLGLPASPEYSEPAARERVLLKPIETIGNRLLLDAHRAYSELLASRDASEHGRPYRFTSRGRAYWGQVTRREFEGGLVLTPAVIVSERDILGPIQTARWLALGLGVGGIVWAVWRCMSIASRFSGPIEALAEESDRIIHGGQTLDHRPVESSVLELAKLSSSQVEMRLAMKTLGKMERDLQVAREIQQALLPESTPALEGWGFGAWSEPADETGGDIYDFAHIDGERDVFMLLADATGHGVGPAISAAQVRAMARMALRTGTDLGGLLENLNAQLLEDLPSGRFITLWAARLDHTTGALRTLSAGQAPLLRYHAGEDRFEVFDASVVPLGVIGELGDVQPDTHALAPGDVYAVFSDGIYEARSPEGEQFGVARTQAALRAARDGTAQDAVESVRRAVTRFTHGAPAEDDRTGVVIRRDA